MPDWEVLGAGSAGPGKSTILLFDANGQIYTEHKRCEDKHHPHYHAWGQSRGWALHLRRTRPMLEETLARAHRAFPRMDSGAHWNEQKTTWTFSSGYKYQFGHCKDPQDWSIYIGNEYTRIFFDELVQFDEEQYDQIGTRLRTTDPVLKHMLGIRSATNPLVTRTSADTFAVKNPHWVRDRFVKPAPQGRVRFKKRIRRQDGTIAYRTFIYLPATLYDNPDPEFVNEPMDGVVNVMQPGELEEAGVGWLATRKVRLIHALVRRRVQLEASNPWRAEWGLPINQEDQAGTLLTFSIATLQGLRKMGARVTAAEADAYITAWSAVGRLLGVDSSLLPSSEEEATLLALRIGKRQVRATPEGRQLTALLLNSVQTLFPVPGYAASLSHFFLQETVFGKDVAAALELPRANWTKWLVKGRAAQKQMALRLLPWVPGARRRRSWVARQFAQRMILHKRPDANTPFEVPPAFRKRWGLHADR